MKEKGTSGSDGAEALHWKKKGKSLGAKRSVNQDSEKMKSVSKTDQVRGKIRRFYKSHFAKKEVRQSLNVRRGACGQCGQCCKILFKCPFLSEKDGKAYCMIYEWRFEQCKLFPMEPKDFKEIPGQCCFHFEVNYEERPSRDE